MMVSYHKDKFPSIGRRMDPDVKAMWLEALRGGKYSQGFGQLRSNDMFCCLGVLCDVVGLDEWQDDELTGVKSYCGETLTLHQSVVNLSGLFNGVGEIPMVGRDGRVISLARLNDFGFTFEQIADVIDYFF